MEKVEWAEDIIKELAEHKITESCDAITAFIAAYKDSDDEITSLMRFEISAEEQRDTYEFWPQGNHYYFYIFEDGSVYYDAKEGIGRFYLSMADLADEDENFRQYCKEE